MEMLLLFFVFSFEKTIAITKIKFAYHGKRLSFINWILNYCVFVDITAIRKYIFSLLCWIFHNFMMIWLAFQLKNPIELNLNDNDPIVLILFFFIFYLIRLQEITKIIISKGIKNHNHHAMNRLFHQIQEYH